MKKDFKALFSIALISPILFSCNSKKLPSITGLKYEDGIVMFDEIEGVDNYLISLSHNNELLYEDTITGNAVDITSLGFAGNLVFTCKAVSGKKESKPSSISITVLEEFDSVIFEAEDNLYNFGTGKTQSNFRNNPLAHKNAYVGGLDDAGQGIYINYLCPFNGTFDIESHYCFHVTDERYQSAKHDIVINGEKQSEFLYTVDTEWGGARFDSEISTSSVTLKRGWNTISIYKNGDPSNNYGDFAEIDYIRLIGNGQEYNPDDLSIYGEKPAKFRLEAEMGSPRKKDKDNLYKCKNPCIAQYANKTFSNGFIMGGIEAKYDGVEWHFDSPVRAKYRISIAYASEAFDGSIKARPSFIVSNTAVLLNKNADFDDMNKLQMDELPYTGWENPVVATQTFDIELKKGDNFIYCLKLDNSGFFQIDYCDLEFLQILE